jgi:hypothetical protein
MKFFAATFLALAVAGGATGPRAGAAGKIEFPKKGSALPGSFSPFVINGRDADNKPITRRHSLVTQFGLKPVVLVFVRSYTDKAVFDFLSKLDKVVGDAKKVDLCAGAVFLSYDGKRNKDDVKAKELVDAARQKDEITKALKEKTDGLKIVRVGIDRPQGPKGYRLGKKDYVTVILYERFTVAGSYVFRIGDDEESGFNAKSAARVLGDVEKWVAALKKGQPAVKKKEEKR